MNLHDVLKNGYSKHKKTNLNGFKLDKNLSNGNNQVYFNEPNGKLVYNVNGTRNLRDWGTDIIAGFGGIKSTNRYKQADKTLKEAKKKYKTENSIISGHSLGGAIGSLISSKNDKVYTLNKYGLGNKMKSNEEGLRTSGDVVSLLNMNSKHMKTINNHSLDPLKSHDLNNIKNKNINII